MSRRPSRAVDVAAGDRATPKSKAQEHPRGSSGRHLSPEHQAALRSRAISDDVIAARDYWTTTSRTELRELGFLEPQTKLVDAGPVLVIPRFNFAGQPDGYQLRPDTPQPDSGRPGKFRKYENLPRRPLTLDAPPACVPYLRRAGVQLYAVEGPLKADAMVSAGAQAVVSVGGVYGWKSADALAALDSLGSVKGRTVTIVPDSDFATNHRVRDGWCRFGDLLARKGAVVQFVQLPHATDGGKLGPDDWLAQGHKLAELTGLSLPHFARFSAPRVVDGRIRPKLIVGNRQHFEEVADALYALNSANIPPEMFVRGGEIVDIRPDETGAHRVRAISEAAMRLRLSEAADVFTTGDTERAVTPPKAIIEGVMAHPNPGFPPLVSLSALPFLRPDGVLVQTAGYDAATGVYLAVPDELANLNIPANPTQAERDQARDVVLDVICDFPFVGDADRANVLSLPLEALTRALFGISPMHIFDKPQRGTGASLLADVFAVIVTGRPSAGANYTGDEAELRKVITSALMPSPTLISFDNAEGRISSPVLSKVLTSLVWGDRILGTQREVALPNRTSWMLNGNNLQIAGDVGRRSVLTRLNAGVERPYLRPSETFRHPDLLEYVRAHRGAIVAAFATLVTAWQAAGRPRGPRVALGGFQTFADICGGILAHAGIPGFLSNAIDLYEQAEGENDELAGFAAKWASLWPSPTSVAQAVSAMSNSEGALCPEWAAIMPDLGNGPRTTRLAYRLRKYKDVVLPGGLAFRVAGKDGHSHRTLWHVVQAVNGGKKANDAPTQTGVPISNANDANDPPAIPSALTQAQVHAGAPAGRGETSFASFAKGGTQSQNGAKPVEHPSQNESEVVP
ncbi:MAG: DUF3854 domain-containing protein [Dehalococcoidia bacterium]|nr:DUF3854 domain-containing protein [Dehalococcoidia bacterium]